MSKRLKWPKPAAPSARFIRTVVIIGALIAALAGTAITFARGSRSPLAVIDAYYDDLDFRRFYSAYSRLDPQTRPSFDQYMLELSVKNGLVASYGKLDSVKSTLIEKTPAPLGLKQSSTGSPH